MSLSGITGSGRETVRISLGPSADAVSSHLSNLEGMACTTTAAAAAYDDDPGSGRPPLCDPHVTHREFRGYLVPRCVFVDSRDGFLGGVGRSYYDDDSSQFATPAMTDGAYYHHHGGGVGANGTIGPSGSSPVVASAAWGGEVERVHRRLPLLDHVEESSTSLTGDRRHDSVEGGAADPFASYRVASARAAASRFDCSSGRINSDENYSTRHRYASHSSNANDRHVNWDDDDGEEEEEYSDEEGAARATDVRRRAALDRRTALEVDATVAWEEACSSFASLGGGNGADNGTVGGNLSAEGLAIPWRDYLAVPPNSMPPSSMLALPFYSTSPSDDVAFSAGSFVSGYSYSPSTTSSQTNPITREWREEGLSESIRSILEECDTVQGFQIVSDDGGMYAGLASSVLEELTDECRSAARLSVLISSSSSSSGDVGGGERSRRGPGGGNDTSSSSSWAARTSFRRMLNDGLSLHGVASRSDAVTPLDLALCRSALGHHRGGEGGGLESSSSCGGGGTTVFLGGAAAALALEASTLPYRLLGSAPRDGRVAMAGLGAVGGGGGGGGGGGDDDLFPTSARIGYRRFVSDLLGGPSGRHNVLAMDGRLRPLPKTATVGTSTVGGDAPLPPAAAMLLASLSRGPGGAASGGGGGGGGGGELYRLLASGTSVEHTGGNDPRMRPRRTTTTAAAAEPGAWIDGNFLSALSLPRPGTGDGESGHEHTNYALHASLRPSHEDLLLAAATKTDPVDRYTLPVMESLAARRPTDGFSSCVVRQSVDVLTSGGYGYWKSSVFSSFECGGGREDDHQQPPSTLTSSSAASVPTAATAATTTTSTIASTPIISLLSNTTRIHPYLHRRARGLGRALSRPYRGYHNVESSAGLAPEREDCDDAMEYLVDLDGAYDSGMDLHGFDLDDEAAYFESNED